MPKVLKKKIILPFHHLSHEHGFDKEPGAAKIKKR